MREFLNQWMPIDASAHGSQVDDLIVLTHWLMAVLFVIWGGYFLIALYRFSAKRHPRADHLGAQTHVSTYGDEEWRELFERAGLRVDAVELIETEIDVEPWLARAGCEGEEAERVRALLADRIQEGRLAMTRIAIKGRKR